MIFDKKFQLQIIKCTKTHAWVYFANLARFLSVSNDKDYWWQQWQCIILCHRFFWWRRLNITVIRFYNLIISITLLVTTSQHNQIFKAESKVGKCFMGNRGPSQHFRHSAPNTIDPSTQPRFCNQNVINVRSSKVILTWNQSSTKLNCTSVKEHNCHTKPLIFTSSVSGSMAHFFPEAQSVYDL